jgi:putative flippase GtrA
VTTMDEVSSARTGSASATGGRYVAVGIINTAFGYGVFAVLDLAFGDTVPYLGLLLVAHVVSVLEAFVLHKVLVFRVQGRWFRDLSRFWSVYLIALGVNLVTLPLLVEIVGLPVLLAQAVVLATLTGATFLAHRHYTFRRPAASSPQSRSGSWSPSSAHGGTLR